MKPRKSGLNWLIWAGPFILLLVGGATLYWTLIRWTARTAATPKVTPPPLSDLARKRIDHELRSLDN